MKEIIKTLLRESLGYEDTYSAHKGMLPYKERKNQFIDSIKTFSDITDEKIPTIIDFLGCEGYNSDEDALEDLTDKINDYRKFPDPVILYRIVAVKNKKLLKTKDLGEHYTPYEWAIDGDMLMSIGYEGWDDDWVPYNMTVSAPLSEIDVWQTLVQNLSFPNEHEINLKNNGRGAKLISAKKYKQ